MDAPTIAIRTTGLTKRFRSGLRGREVLALVDVGLEVQRGEIFGLLGPNGAGKTTLIKILLGSLRPTSGAASINGHECSHWRARQKAGFLPENHRFPPYLTGQQMLEVYGGMAGWPRAAIKARAGELLQLVDMSRWRRTRIKKYSKGMMQRLGLAQALLNDPEIIFLDEPTDGVDPIGRHEIRQILLRLKEQGKTVFLNSHLLAEVESVCDRVAILDKGKLVKVGSVEGLVAAGPGYHVETLGLPPEVAEKAQACFMEAHISGTSISVSPADARLVNDLIDLLRQSGVDLVSVKPHKISLEESFMQLIKGGGTNE